jgi:diaminopimelate decarboxylase
VGLTDLLPLTWEVAGGRASVGGVALSDLAAEYGTPLYVMDVAHLRKRLTEYREAFGEDTVLAYASKAFFCPDMAALLAENGWWADVVSLAEAVTARVGGMPADSLLFHGNNKTPREIEYAAESRIGRLVIDNTDEVASCAGAAVSTASRLSVMLRLALDVDVDTHPNVRTSGHDSHFGIPLNQAAEALRLVASHDSLLLTGVHAHVGSQIYDFKPLCTGIEHSIRFVAAHRNAFPEVVDINVGGGLASPYLRRDRIPSLPGFAVAVRHATEVAARRHGIGRWRLMIEPGRSIVANAGITLYQVGSHKEMAGARIVSVDGGMSDNPRHILYGARYEALLPARLGDKHGTRFRVVGRHCETGDVLIRSARLPADTGRGDLLAIPVTGAYCYSMSSRYNLVPRPPVVFVESGVARISVPGEDLEELVGGRAGLTDPSTATAR